jgi:hypothetical protein
MVRPEYVDLALTPKHRAAGASLSQRSNLPRPNHTCYRDTESPPKTGRTLVLMPRHFCTIDEILARSYSYQVR